MRGSPSPGGGPEFFNRGHDVAETGGLDSFVWLFFVPYPQFRERPTGVSIDF